MLSFALGCSTVLFLGCTDSRNTLSPEAPPPADAVARINEEYVTTEQLRERITDTASAESVRDELDRVLEERSILARAASEGFLDRPEVQQAIDQLIISAYRDHHLQNSALAVSDDDVLEYYTTHIGEFTKPAARRLGVIQISRSNEQAMDALPLMQKADDVTFKQLAAKFSEDQSTRYRGGDAGWIVENEPYPRWPQEVIDAAWSLDTIGVSSPSVEVGDFCYVIKLLAMEAPKTNSFRTVADVIRHQLTGQRRAQIGNEFAEDLKNNSDIEIYEEKLNRLIQVQPTAPTTPPQTPRP